MNSKIIEGDSLHILKTIPDNSVDVVFTDPPYNAKKDYGVYKDNLPKNEYVEWMDNVISESVRVSRKGVCVYVSGDLSFLFYSLLYDYGDVNHIVVHKKAAGVCKNNIAKQYHSIITNIIPVKRTRNLWDDIRLPGEGYFFKEDRYDNPGLTSLKLTEKFLEHFTVEGDVVVDPFGGVGTTAVACKKMNRNYFLVELNPDYIEVANERLGKL